MALRAAEEWSRVVVSAEQHRVVFCGCLQCCPHILLRTLARPVGNSRSVCHTPLELQVRQLRAHTPGTRVLLEGRGAIRSTTMHKEEPVREARGARGRSPARAAARGRCAYDVHHEALARGEGGGSSPRRGVPVCTSADATQIASAKKKSVRFICGQQERASARPLHHESCVGPTGLH